MCVSDITDDVTRGKIFTNHNDNVSDSLLAESQVLTHYYWLGCCKSGHHISATTKSMVDQICVIRLCVFPAWETQSQLLSLTTPLPVNLILLLSTTIVTNHNDYAVSLLKNSNYIILTVNTNQFSRYPRHHASMQLTWNHAQGESFIRE